MSTAPSESCHLPPESAYFLSVNRNKRSITVNFKTPEGLEIMERLVKRSDVLVENFVSGKLASMALGWEDCRKINPRLIYASITGMVTRLCLMPWSTTSVQVTVKRALSDTQQDTM
jgi:succinate--hydroxymethylglutarate CoA-transferase